MKNNKGFTLIEVVTILVILSIILSIIIPSILGIVNDSKDNINENQQNQLENAARMWYLNSEIDLEVGQSCQISVDKIIELEYIESNEVIDMKTQERMVGYVVISHEEKQYSYKYSDVSSVVNCIKEEVVTPEETTDENIETNVE